MTEQFDIESASVETLKSMAYDELCKLQVAQNNLAALNKAIEFKLSPKTVEESKEIITNDNDTSTSPSA